jgi:hypothetical protein
MGSVVGSLFGGNNAIQDGSNRYQATSQDVLDMYRKMWEQQQAQQQPWLGGGSGAMNKLNDMFVNGKGFSAQDLQLDPGYQFRLAEGQKALDRSAAARGGLQSGNALAAAANYGQGMASQEYQNAYNRMVNPLMQMSGMGQGAANQLGQFAGQYGRNYGDTNLGAASDYANAAMAKENQRNSMYGDVAKFGGKLFGF